MLRPDRFARPRWARALTERCGIVLLAFAGLGIGCGGGGEACDPCGSELGAAGMGGSGGTVDMDARAAELGLQLGQTYRMDIFQAERHCCNSRFHLETTLSCINNIIVE